jgi:hypothetical protein
MKIEQYHDLPPELWDAACDISQQAWLFHRAAWIDVEERFFVRKNLSFALKLKDHHVGIHPLYLSDRDTGTGGERLLHSGIHRHTGLSLIDNLDPAATKTAQSIAMRHIFTLAEEHDVDRIQLNAHNLTPENRSPARREIPFWIGRHGFFLGLQFGTGGMVPAPGMATCNADQIIDLSKSEEDLFRLIDDRENVRKAQAADVTFELGEHDSCIHDYYAIAEKSAQRTGEALLPEDYFQTIWRTFHPYDRCAVLFAKKDATRVAALLLLIDKGAASYSAGVSDPEYLHLRVNNFLHWSAIVWARRKGLTHYRLGPVFPELPGDWPVSKVSAFKRKFGAQPVTIIQGSHFRHPDLYLTAAIAHLRLLCKKQGS